MYVSDGMESLSNIHVVRTIDITCRQAPLKVACKKVGLVITAKFALQHQLQPQADSVQTLPVDEANLHVLHVCLLHKGCHHV